MVIKMNGATNALYNHVEFWTKVIDKEIKKSSFSDQISYNKNINYSNIKFMISEEVTRKILSVCNNSNIGIYIYLISAVQYILKIYSGNNDIVIGIDSLPRQKNIIEQSNKILMFKSSINDEDSFKELLLQSKEMFVNINKFNDLDIHQIQKIIGIEEFDRKAAIIDTIVRVNNSSSNKELKGFDVSTIFEFKIEDNNIFCNLKYDVNSISKLRIKSIEKHILNFLEEVVIKSDIKLKMIDILQEERKRLMENGEGKDVHLNEDEMIIDLFEKQVEKAPSNIAVVFEDKILTYRELNEKANQLARILRYKGVNKNSIVGIMVERSVEMIIGIMSILKSGGAYFPIDAVYPKERIEYMLKDSKSSILLTTQNLLSNIKFSGEIIDLLDDDLFQGDVSNLEKINKPNDLIYVIYTSGTTGNPKGAMVKQQSFTNLMQWYCNEFNISEKDNVLLIASVSFDLAQKNIYAPLIVGGKLILANKGIINYEKVNKIISENQITIINCAPSAFNPIVQLNRDTNYIELIRLKYVFLGGEPINLNLLEDWMNSVNYRAEIVNTYGPTECTDIAACYRIKNQQGNMVPIGKPINNAKVYILGKNKEMLPIGVPGELYISGVGVSRGYLDKTELTAEKFIDNPFDIGTKMYKTGDLVRWLPDGNMEFLGRMDHQIKIRGFRIEIDEIEKNLLYIEKVDEAVVIDKEDEFGNKYLCAYLVLSDSITVKELREILGKKLPNYMIPSCFIEVDKIPLNNNGKIDRKALMALDGSIKRGNVYQAARNITEEILTETWTEILKVKRIGIKDNFLELGGNSLNAMFLVSRIHKSFKVDISITDILELGTIESISKYIDEHIGEYSYNPLINVDKKEFYPVSSSQKRMFILQNLNPLDTAYNDQLVKLIKGNLDIKKLEKSFISLINRHEALRTSFKLSENEVVQIIHDNINFNIEVIEQGNKNINDLITNFIKPFDLRKAPLIRARIIRIKDSNYIMILDIHHICIDAITMQILTNELSLLYNGEMLPDIEYQYKDFSCWQKELLKTPLIQHQKEYWYNNLKNHDFKSNIFSKCNLNYRGNSGFNQINFSIGSNLEFQLGEFGKVNQITLYVILLTAYKILLYKFSGESDIIVGTPIAGRNHLNLDKIVGVFINTLPIRSFLNPNKTIRELLNEVKETTHNLFKNQDYPFDYIINDLNIERNENKNPLFNTMFALNNINYRKLDLSKLEIVDYEINKSGLMMDMLLEAEILNNELTFKFEYDDMIFSKKLVDKFIYNYIKILRKIMENDIRIEDIELEES